MDLDDEMEERDVEDGEDWQIDDQGFYVATRGFLLRRGYCCGNRCRNCPYINWREQPDWQHAPAEAVQFATVPAHILTAARRLLAHSEGETAAHYRHLLERWWT